MSGYPEPMPAKVDTNPHDPGADAAATAFDGSSDVAANPFPAGERRHDPDRHRVVDRPDHDRGRCLLSARRRLRGGAAPVLRLALPAGRSRCHVLLAPRASDRGAVGRAHATGLRVRHQGPRIDDRPADRDQAPAEGPPRGTPGRRRREGTDLRQGPARRPQGRRLGVVRRRPRAARRGRSARLDPAPVPALVLHLVGEPRHRSRTPSIDCAASA